MAEKAAHKVVTSERIDALLEEQDALAKAEGPRVPFKWYDAATVVIFLALFGVVFLQFFTRYVLNDSISWTEEAARYLLICLTFAGSIKCQELDLHIRLEVIDQIAPKWVRPLKAFSLAAVTGFGVFACWSVWQLIQRTSFQQMISLPFPKYYLYSVVLAAMAIFCCVCLSQLIRLIGGARK